MAGLIALSISIVLNGGSREMAVIVFSLAGMFCLVGLLRLIVTILGVVSSRNRILRPGLALPFFGVKRGA